MCERAKTQKFSETSEGSSKQTEPIPGYQSVEQFTKDGFKTLVEAIKHSNALPSGRNWDFYNTSESFKEIMKDEGSTVLRLMNQVMHFNEIDDNIRHRVLDEKIELVIEANDVILEKVANNIDEINGIRKVVAAPVVLQTVSAQLPVNGSWNRQTAATIVIPEASESPSTQNCIKLITAKNIIRPQKFFKDQIDNRNKAPWCPRITEKPNSLKPLAIFLEEYEDRQEYSHPYEFELDRFQPTPSQLRDETPILPPSVSQTPLIEIDKPEQLDELVETLRHCKEFAVDVEHHSYRSFMGFTCLVQISTQDTDYLIDALALRDKLCILNEVFTKNTIVKIFHGADKDIEWLQRDLSIYVVNMFDTHQAAKALQYPQLSLAFLMKKFCNILPNKQFQLADWRIRPLPNELKKYAREDTHYLIYIYKMMKRELLNKAHKSDKFLRSVIDRSTDICKKRYFKPILSEDSHLDLLRKCKKMFDNRQLYALKEIYAWRDNLARIEDESWPYVLPNHMMLQICEALPREMQGILACCNPIPPLVRSHLLELHQIILKAREQPLEKAILKETTGRGVLKEKTKVNIDNSLHCPHDLSKTSEFRDDLPTILQNENYKSGNKTLTEVELTIEKKSSYSLFQSSFDCDDGLSKRETFKKVRGLSDLSPYQRYKLVKPIVETEEKAKQQTQEEQISEESKEEETRERTDDERIASIRDHFLQLSKKFSEELQAQKQKEEKEKKQREILCARRKRFHEAPNEEESGRSLIEMGGSRKRKVDETYDVGDNSLSTPENNFLTPAPNIQGKKGKKSRYFNKKRTFDEMNDGGVNNNQGNVSKKKKKKNKGQQQFNQGNNSYQNQSQPKKKKKKQKAKMNQGGLQQQNFQSRNEPQYQDMQNTKNMPSQSNKQGGLQHKNVQFKNKPKYQNTQSTQNMPSKSNRQGGLQHKNVQFKNKPNYQNTQNMPSKRNVQNRQNMQGRQNNVQNKKFKNKQQQNSNFSPYDYASVDFRQFQGGAGTASGAIQIKQKFKPKIRDDFLQQFKKFIEKLQVQTQNEEKEKKLRKILCARKKRFEEESRRSLIEMSAPRIRKIIRYNNNSLPTPQNNFVTPIPNIQEKKSNKSRYFNKKGQKRIFDEMNDSGVENNQGFVSKKKKNKNKRQQQFNQGNNSNQNQCQPKKKKKKQKAKMNQGGLQHQNCQSRNEPQYQNMTRKRNKQRAGTASGAIRIMQKFKPKPKNRGKHNKNWRQIIDFR